MLHPANFFISHSDLYRFDNQVRLSELNQMRGECAERLGKICPLFLNKITWNGREAATRVIESFDPQFLWISGDLDLKRSSRQLGTIYIVYGILAGAVFFNNKNKKKLVIISILLALPSAALESHYHITGKLGLVIFLTWMASQGLMQILNQKNARGKKLFIIGLLLTEMIMAIHTFIYHYMSRP